MDNVGYVKLHRKVTKNIFWYCEPFSKGQAWVDLLLKASHKESKVYFRDEIIEVLRGEIITSELKLAEQWKWSRTKVRKFLSMLSNEGQITVKKDKRKTTIKLLNYCVYQDFNSKDSTTERQQTVQQKDIFNKIKKNNKIKKKQIDTPYSDITNQFNSICKDMSNVVKVTDKRKRKIDKLSKVLDEFNKTPKMFFEMIANSEFLNGENNRSWKANFDWVIEGSNAIKILEGQYQNKGGKNNGSSNKKSERKNLQHLYK